MESDDTGLNDLKKLKKPDEDVFGMSSEWNLDAQQVKDKLRKEHNH